MIRAKGDGKGKDENTLASYSWVCLTSSRSVSGRAGERVIDRHRHTKKYSCITHSHLLVARGKTLDGAIIDKILVLKTIAHFRK